MSRLFEREEKRTVTKGEAGARGLDFAALRRAIERREPDFMIGFYADEATVRIVNSDFPRSAPLELRGKAEICKYLRAVFGQKTIHRIEREIVEEDRVVLWESCEYLDGSLVVVETTLEERDGKIIHQIDEVILDGRTTCEGRDANEAGGGSMDQANA